MKIMKRVNRDQLVADLTRIKREYPKEMERAVWQEGALIMNESQRQCPVAEGRLRATREDHTEVPRGEDRMPDEPDVQPGKISLKLGYYTEYAIYVHENPKAYHQPPTKWKFLEDPLMERAPKIARNLLKRVEMMVARRTG